MTHASLHDKHADLVVPMFMLDPSAEEFPSATREARSQMTNPRATAGPSQEPDPAVEPASYVADAATRLHRAVYQTGTARLRHWNTTLSSYAAMRVMLARPDLTLAQLSRRCFVRPQTMTRMVRDLETRGWVVRSRRDDDDRALSLRLSQDGEAAIAEMDAEARKINTTIEKALSASEIDLLNDLLRRCAREVEADLRLAFPKDAY